MQIKLTKKEKNKLESQHKYSKNSKECDRIKAVLLTSENWTVSAISQALRISQSSVTRHINDYNIGRKLNPESGGSESYLSQQQTKELINHLSEHLYQDTKEIIKYINDKYEIEYSIPGLNKWLHRNGFSYKKPKGNPHKADPSKQQEFIKKYENLKKKTSSSEPILFMDSMHPSMATKLGYGWIKKGEDKTVDTTASRTRVNIVGAIQLGRLDKMVVDEYKTVNSESIIDILKKIKKKYRKSKTVHLILDGAGYHKSEIVKKCAKKLKIKLHFLPPYSPNLNPIERLWKVMNEKVRNNKFFNSVKEFRDNIMNFFHETIPVINNTLKDRINDNFQILNDST
jgi:transposase